MYLLRRCDPFGRPAQIIPRGLFTESALAWIATSKYLDGLPLYRRVALLGRFGGTDISRNTVASSIVRVGQAVQPVINLLRDELLDSPLVFGDETELQVLKEPGRGAQTKSFMWAQMTDGSGMSGTGPPIRLFAYSPSRSTKTARELYAGMRQGAVFMSNGYDVYDAMAIEHKLVHLGCCTHCRRYFNDALQALPKDKRGPERLPARFIDLIGKLYYIEAQARRDEVDGDEPGRRRREQSSRVLADIEALLLADVHAVVPSGLLGQALHYLSSQWPKLKRYVENGRYSIDNNAPENAIRPFCVGRRAWLFADTMAGAHTSANLYSLLQTCQVNGIDGYRYLRLAHRITVGHHRRQLLRAAAPESQLERGLSPNTDLRASRSSPLRHRRRNDAVSWLCTPHRWTPSRGRLAIWRPCLRVSLGDNTTLSGSSNDASLAAPHLLWCL